MFLVAHFSFFQVANQRDNLLNYIIFLRITPFLPNWFINITSPVIEVPLTPFFIGTFIGGRLIRLLTASASASCMCSYNINCHPRQLFLMIEKQ